LKKNSFLQSKEALKKTLFTQSK